MNINTAHIAGRVTKKPELRALPSGIKITTFSIATNYVYKKESGEKVEEVEFHNIVSFGRQAETIAQYVEQGQVLYIEGRIKTESWEKDGIKKQRTTIIANNFQFGERAKNSPRSSDNNVGKDWEKIDNPTDEDLSVEDIPF